MKNKNYIYSNNIGKKATALILTIALAGMGMCGCGLPGKTAADAAMDTVTEAFTDDDATLLSELIATQVGTTDESVDKEESVYVVADANGATKEVIVSDWLKNTSGEKTIVDQSDLTDIKNIKGEETFENDGENITWNADGSSIYYQGTTDKELPVSMNITYYLDGQEMTADEIAGKSGNVTIRFDYTNNEKVETSVDGKDTEVYVPFTVMSTMILPTDKFADINVTNGKVMSEGNNNIVMGLAFPGLTESLDLDKEELEEKDISIPDYVEVNAITSDFQLDMTLSVILSDALSDIHLTDSIDLSELEDGMNDLTDATTKLEDGSGALRDGVQELSDKTGEFSNGAKELYDGVVKYTDGVSQIESGVNTLKEGSGALSSGANELSAGAATLNEKVQAISLPSGSLTEEQKNQISSAVAADPLLSAGASQLSKGITQAALGSVASSINSSDSIKAAASSVKLDKSSVTIGIGESFTVSSIIPSNAAAATRTYSSSNSSVVQMTRTNWVGVFKGVKAGTATVTVKLQNGKTATCKVTVKKAPTSVGLNKTTLNMKVGQTATLSATIASDAGCATRTFRTSNASVVKMTKTNWTGTFKALKKGTAYVTVRTYNGKEKSCKVVVS